jgi:hypothetical protein
VEKKRFTFKKKEKIHTLPYEKKKKITGGNSNNRIAIVKKIMKEKD